MTLVRMECGWTCDQRDLCFVYRRGDPCFFKQATKAGALRGNLSDAAEAPVLGNVEIVRTHNGSSVPFDGDTGVEYLYLVSEADIKFKVIIKPHTGYCVTFVQCVVPATSIVVTSPMIQPLDFHSWPDILADGKSQSLFLRHKLNEAAALEVGLNVCAVPAAIHMPMITTVARVTKT
jgi:hypothetical protein